MKDARLAKYWFYLSSMNFLRTLLKPGCALGITAPALFTSTLLLSPAPARAAACGGPGTPTTGTIVFGGGFSCTLGDKTYKNFATTNVAIPSGTTFQWSTFGNQYNMSIQGAFASTGSPFGITYDIEIDPTNDQFFHSLQTSATSATQSPGFSKSLAAVPVTVPSPVIGTNLTGGGNSPMGIFPGLSKVASFTSILVVTGDPVTQFQDTVTQKSSVPGPLPILGASMAFGFSRKLRRRIKVTA